MTANHFTSSFTGVTRGEFIKLGSLRSIRWTVVLTVLMGFGIGVLASTGLSDYMEPSMSEGYLVNVVAAPVMFLALLFGVLGVFTFGSEHTSGMILSTLTATPRRGRVFGAKIFTLAIISIVSALIITAMSLAVAVWLLPDSAQSLTAQSVLTSVLGALIFTMLMTLTAGGIATILRSTAGGIATVAGITFVLPIAAQVLGSLTQWEWIRSVEQVLPLMLAQELSMGFASGGAAGGSLNDWLIAAASMLGWALASIVPAYLLFRTRDAR